MFTVCYEKGSYALLIEEKEKSVFSLTLFQNIYDHFVERRRETVEMPGLMTEAEDGREWPELSDQLRDALYEKTVFMFG